MSSRATITALVPTFNEERNIRDCLSCLTWVDQLIVVDSFSTDKTVEIAREFTQHVYQHEYVNSATQKNWAMTNLPIEGDWTLIVDADERVVPELAEEIQQVLMVCQARTDGLSAVVGRGFIPRQSRWRHWLAGRGTGLRSQTTARPTTAGAQRFTRDVAPEGNDPAYSGYFLNRRNIFFGHWIKHAGMYPSWNLRLFRTGQGVYETKEVDADVYLRDQGKVGYLQKDMLHYSFPTVESCVNRINRYSGWDARERLKPKRAVDDKAVPVGLSGRLRTAARRVFEKLPAKPVVLFTYMYFIQRGFLDGRAGFYTCGLWAFREYVTDVKAWELREAGAKAREVP